MIRSSKLQKTWQQRIQSWRDSGLSQKAWCEQHQIKQPQFWYWKKKLSPSRPENIPGQPVTRNQSEPSSGFVPVSVMHPEPDGLSVSLPNGLTVSGIAPANLQLASQLIEVLR